MLVLWMTKMPFPWIYWIRIFPFCWRSLFNLLSFLSLLSRYSVGSPRTKKIPSVVQNPSAIDLDLKTVSTNSSNAQRLNCLSSLHRDKGLLVFFRFHLKLLLLILSWSPSCGWDNADKAENTKQSIIFIGAK